jgi:hypothetical protein
MVTYAVQFDRFAVISSIFNTALKNAVGIGYHAARLGIPYHAPRPENSRLAHG